MFDVSSSFKSEAQERMFEPVRRFYISNSDYSDRVKTWPKIKREAIGLKATSLTVKLANTDGAMNEFYKGQYKLKDEIKFTMGVPDIDLDYSEVFSDYTLLDVTLGVASVDHVKLVESVNSAQHIIYDRVQVTGGTNYNTKFYYDVKLKVYKGEGGIPEKNRVKIGISDATRWPGMFVYLDNGSYYITGSDYIFYTAVTSEDGFWRATIGVGGYNVSTVTPFIVLVNSDGEQTYDGDGISFIWAGDSTLKGPEAIDLYTGEINKITYSKNDCVIKVRDKMWDFAQKVVGGGGVPTTIPGSGYYGDPSTGFIVSDIAWTLCTCYGELDNTQDSSNPDINYESFAEWAEQFSTDTVYARSFYDDVKVISALTNLARMSDSSIWIEGDGKLYFKKFSTIGSEDIVFTNDEMGGLNVDIDMDRLKNKHWVFFNYIPNSDDWDSVVYDIRSTSVNTFGLREEVLKDTNFWYVDSVSALNIAARHGTLLSDPNRRFNFISGMYGLYSQIGDTARLVNSFYDLTSGQGWTIEAITYDMDKVKNKYQLNEALVLDGFFLDVSTLDGDMLLL